MIAATVLSELAEKIKPNALVSLADLYAVPDVQRLGYLLERIAEDGLADPLVAWLKSRRFRPVPLVSGKAKGAESAHPKWRVIPNELLETDL
ncbi:MAG: type IV toxin-antitoxin system AbiEi family antitoxin [Syntrophaceae bacterium]|jgi:hypothetical protein|nr:type IV toxin-antitoxin system AbiEi family antitoxin [Syntrophaceae bacterium]